MLLHPLVTRPHWTKRCNKGTCWNFARCLAEQPSSVPDVSFTQAMTWQDLHKVRPHLIVATGKGHFFLGEDRSVARVGSPDHSRSGQRSGQRPPGASWVSCARTRSCLCCASNRSAGRVCDVRACITPTAGPAVTEEAHSTILLPPGWPARVRADGHLEARPSP